MTTAHYFYDYKFVNNSNILKKILILINRAQTRHLIMWDRSNNHHHLKFK